MTQPKSKSSKSKSSKKTTPAATSKKVKRTTSALDARPAAVELAPALETTTAPQVKTATVALEVVEKTPTRLVSRAEFMDLVRKEAYRRYAARRAFKNGSPFQDWVNAEAAVSGKLAAEGARLS